MEDDKDNATEIQTFFNTCLQCIYNIRWPEMIPNEELWEQAGQEPVEEEVGLDQTHPQEASIQHHTPSSDLELTGREEERPASQLKCLQNKSTTVIISQSKARQMTIEKN